MHGGTIYDQDVSPTNIKTAENLKANADVNIQITTPRGTTSFTEEPKSKHRKRSSSPENNTMDGRESRTSIHDVKPFVKKEKSASVKVETKKSWLKKKEVTVVKYYLYFEEMEELLMQSHRL